MDLRLQFPDYVPSGAFSVPNPDGFIGQPWIVTDHSAGNSRGNVYVLAHVGDGVHPERKIDIMATRSEDGGETWSAPIRVNDDVAPNLGWQWFGTMSVAPNGRIDVVWNDSRNYTQYPNGNMVELFYSSSVDGGDTWAPNIPVSPVFDSYVGWPAGGLQRKLGDYYTMVSDNLGANVAYAATFNGEQDVYFLRIGPWDCNGNELDDAADIASATSKDCNGNAVPDECEYRVDTDGDGLTTVGDYKLLSSALSGPAGSPPTGCNQLSDANHDGHIDLADYAYLQRVFVAP